MLTLRSLLKLIGFAALAVLYNVLVTTTVRELWQPIPSWWVPHLASLGVSFVASNLLWMHVIHGLALLAAALPVAIAIRFAKLQQPVAVAFMVSFAALVVPLFALSYASYLNISLMMKLLTVLDLLKFTFTLPILVWLLQRWRPTPPATESTA